MQLYNFYKEKMVCEQQSTQSSHEN